MKVVENNDNYVLKVRNLTIEDFPDLDELTRNIYGSMTGGYWRYESIKNLLELFPEGQIALEDKGKVIAFALSLRIRDKELNDEHVYKEIITNGTFSSHDEDGKILYGIEVTVSKDYQGMRLGRRLYDARKDLCEKLNLKAIIAGGRMPGYHKYAEILKPRDYIRKVRKREIYDPVLTFQLSNDFHVKKVLPNYLPSDKESMGYATLIEWNNVYYEEKRKIVGGRKSWCRIGVVQWQMRSVTSLESFFSNAEFFIDSVSNYGADFVLFPELLSAPLMIDFNKLDSAKAIRKLAEYTPQIRERFIQYAIEYNINIIAGSLPFFDGYNVYNVSYLCKRDGTWDEQRKIHITPSEKFEWGMAGGDTIKVFETDVGKIGILICYDSEFPELGRILAEKGMQILFVPFATDTVTGYQRVKICSQARAIENECYVAIAGSVGNLPKVKNMDLNYAQSAVYSPSDFAFPQDATISAGTPNTEMTIIADVDLDLLKELHTMGSVNNLKDRRKDLYEIVKKNSFR
jgi:predicted amidohydrolase/ribosomal protein S18 acetylase RimI-like enzyme